MKKLSTIFITILALGSVYGATTKSISGNSAYHLYLALDLVPTVVIGSVSSSHYGGKAPGPNKTFIKKLDGLICEKKAGYSFGIPACAPDCGNGSWQGFSSTECHLDKNLSHKQKEKIYDSLNSPEDHVETDVQKIWSKTVGTIFFEKKWSIRGGPYYWINKEIVFAKYEGEKAKNLYDSLDIHEAPSGQQPQPYSYKKEEGPLKCVKEEYDAGTWLMTPKYFCVFKGYISQK